MSKLVKGVTLVELLLVMTVIAILVVAMTGAINPKALVAKANDSRRKKDIGRIKVSFEDYYNDRNCYPPQAEIDALMDNQNCGSNQFSPWMNSWPCDPTRKQPYTIILDDENGDCPNWYKIYTNLENKLDTDIPEGWYDDPYYTVGDGNVMVEDANYGDSSTNVSWYDYVLSPACGDGSICRYDDLNQDTTNCSGIGEQCVSGGNIVCFSSKGNECLQQCRVARCP